MAFSSYKIMGAVVNNFRLNTPKQISSVKYNLTSPTTSKKVYKPSCGKESLIIQNLPFVKT